jgi:hypothetical protein
MRRSPVQSNRVEASHRVQSLVDFITITSGSRFSAHTGACRAWPTLRGATEACALPALDTPLVPREGQTGGIPSAASRGLPHHRRAWAEDARRAEGVASIATPVLTRRSRSANVFGVSARALKKMSCSFRNASLGSRCGAPGTPVGQCSESPRRRCRPETARPSSNSPIFSDAH